MEILSPNDILGWIGAGCMAQSIMFPLLDKGLVNPKSVIVSANTTTNLDIWEKRGCRVTQKNEEVVEKSNIIIWAVKPQIFPIAVDGIIKRGNRETLKHDTLHISIMAGISLDQFSIAVKSVMNKEAPGRTLRIMPNIGLQVSCGVAVFACSADVKDCDEQLIKNMFTPIGLVYKVEEHQINAYCGFFGSGIGFMFPIMEALSDGAVKMGIPRSISLEIAGQVMKGAGELYLQKKMHPAALKDMVCSPGGTTIAGISELERGGVRSTLINAIEAATLRGQELGKVKTATSPQK